MSTTYTEWGLGYRLSDGSIQVIRDGIAESTARNAAKKRRAEEMKVRETLPRDEWAAIPEVIRRTVTLGEWEDE